MLKEANLFNLDLNELREGASTTSFGKVLQAFTTLLENTFARTFNLDRFCRAKDCCRELLFHLRMSRTCLLKLCRSNL